MILIVDDNVDISAALVRLLRTHGYDALSCTDGAEALTQLDKHELPALVILDFEMPGMNGHEVLRAMRASARYCEIPVLVYTADASERTRTESLRIGAQAHLVKASLDWKRLLDDIKRLAGAPA